MTKDPNSALRSLPRDEDAEKAVLSCILQDPDSIFPEARKCLTDSDFALPVHRIIFKAICRMAESGKEIDLIMLQSELREKKVLEKVGGPKYLAELIDDVPTLQMFPGYVEKVQSKTQYRQLIAVCNEVVAAAYKQTEQPEDLAQRLESHNTTLFETVAETSDTSWQATLVSYQEEIEKAYENPGVIPGISTGFPNLDDMTNGLEPKQLWIFAGRPGGGKTALLCNMASGLAKMNVPVGVISLEMSREKLAGRIIAGKTKINSQKIARGFISKMDMREIGNAFSQVMDWPIFIDDRSGLRSIDIRIQARKWVKEHGIKVLFVDYLQLVESNQSREQEEREIAEKSKDLLNIAREFEITVCALAQLNRGPEKRTGPPKKSDLRGSGAIEQDAHCIVLLDRTDPEDESAVVEVDAIVAKCREGREGTVPMYFNRPITTFTEQSHGNDSKPKSTTNTGGGMYAP